MDKEKRLKSMRRYVNSEKGKETRKKYLSTPHRDKARKKGSKSWYDKHPDYYRDYYKRARLKPDYKIKERHNFLMRRYGISYQEYSVLIDTQNGRCSICEEVKGEKLVVDHDHKTGKVRSLLCTQCNTAIGMAKENEVILEKMIVYVKKYK